MNIILASKSPRRIEMMKELGFPFLSVDSNTNEVPSNQDPILMVKELAKAKVMAIKDQYKDNLILGFDTLVFLNDHPIGKPHSKEECVKMIQSLSGKTHKVLTGGYLYLNNHEESFYGEALVTFNEISSEEIISYSETKEPYDKAGGYAIQGYIGRFISKIEGDIFSVVGMPKAKVFELLKRYYK